MSFFASKTHRLLVVCVACAAGASECSADILGSYTRRSVAGQSHAPGQPITDGVNVRFSNGWRDHFPLNEGWLFNDVILGPGSQGSDFVANAATDPVSFATISSLLSNGLPDYVAVYFRFPASSGNGGIYTPLESSAFQLDAGRIDFSGYAINAIVLRVDSIVFYEDTSGNFPFTIYDLTATIRVEGTPIPATPVIAFFAAAPLAFRRRARSMTV